MTRSGTNNVHGTAYEYYRDPRTTSNNWFIKQGQLNSGAPNVAAKVLQHTYGASLGLPLKKDKLYFFGAYEGFKQASDIPVGQFVPSTLGGGGLVTGNVTYEACPTSAPCKNGTSFKTLTPAEIATLNGRSSDKSCLTTTCLAPTTDAAAIAFFKQYPLANAPGGDGYNTGSQPYTNFSVFSPLTATTTTSVYEVTTNNFVDVQDQWKATPQLTLTYGIRYVYLGVPYERNGQQIAPSVSLNDFLNNQAGAAAAGTVYDTRVAFRASGSANNQPNFWTLQKLNFAPRVAFAYAAKDSKTSIRGGFALAYDHFGAGIIDGYQSNTQSLFSLSQTNLQTFTDINSNPPLYRLPRCADGGGQRGCYPVALRTRR